MAGDLIQPLPRDPSGTEGSSLGDHPHGISLDSIQPLASEVVAPPAGLIESDHFYKDPHTEEDLRDRRQDRDERRRYATKIFWLMSGWMLGAGSLLAASSVRFWLPPPSLASVGIEMSDAVKIALITSTFTNVIGLFAIVANYLFPKGRSVRNDLRALRKEQQ